MFKAKILSALTIIFSVGSCTVAFADNPFAQFYTDQIAGRNILEVKSVEIQAGKPQLVRGTYVTQDNKRMSADNYYRLGQSFFNGSNIDERDAIIFGRKIHAAMILLYAPYTPDMLADDPTVLADFQQKAGVWLALAQKPPLPEEAHKFRVLADNAIQNNQFDKAAAFLDDGLAIDPTWPAGQYNAARIFEELKEYSLAAMHMKCYLMLKPDDKNARAYQDEIYVWQEKAQEVKDSYVKANRYNFLATYWIKGKAPVLGAIIRDLTPQERNIINSNKGVMVISVLNDSPAFMADILNGDVIKRLNDIELIDSRSFLDLLKSNAGKKVALTIFRNGQEILKTVQLNAVTY